jgi:catechol 2,3-dioxygenase-like lactoylglutathione lyase family enzyme
MANERTYPCLPCAELDPAIAFYEALGFAKTYRQLRPNPYAVMQREDLHVHLFGMAGFDPEQSYATAIVAVPDPDALYNSFAAGLRAAYGKLPVKGIPRVTRPRKRYGTVYGFSLVDVGGNWLRVSKLGEAESSAEEGGTSGKEKGLLGVLDVAARLGDAHGDERKALRTLESGLKRFPDASVIERARALLYRAELAVRLEDGELARASLEEAGGLAMSAPEREAIAGELAHAVEIVASGVEQRRLHDPGA